MRYRDNEERARYSDNGGRLRVIGGLSDSGRDMGRYERKRGERTE